MSAIILALGVIMSAVLGFYNINNMKRRVFQTKNRLNKIELAIQNYVLKNGKFPCPTPLNCDEDGCKNSSDKFGFENRDNNDNCIYNNENIAIFKSKNSENEDILYGAVPFITLDIANNYSIDAWGNKIVYMIPLSLTKDGSFQKMVLEKRKNNSPEYLKNGIAYILMSFAKNKQGEFLYNETDSNNFSGDENMPINNFKVNTKNKNYIYLIKNFKEFEIVGLEEELQECGGNNEEWFSIEGTSEKLTFPKAKFGEIAFSNETCPKSVHYPPLPGDYYYISKGVNGVMIDNRAGKRCGKNGKWEEGYVYECVRLSKCPKPSSVLKYSLKDWSDFNFEIVNTGIVYSKDEEDRVEMKCMVNRINNTEEAKWYDTN